MGNITGSSQILNNSTNPELNSEITAMEGKISVIETLTMLICMCGMVGNGVVVWLLGCHVQRNPFSVYVLNLAMADTLLLLFIPLGKYGQFDGYTQIRILVVHVKYFAYITSLSLLTAISMHRCLSVLFPIWYKVHRPLHLSTVVCSLIWILALLVITPLTYLDFMDNDVSEFNHDQNYETLGTFLVFLFLGIFLPVMILSSMVIFVQHQRRPPEWRQQSSRLFVIILTSVLVFLLCSLPLSILWATQLISPLKWGTFYLFQSVAQFTSSMSSSANPFIYFLVGRGRSTNLKEPLRAILSRALQEDTDSPDKETPSTNTDEMGSVSSPATVSAQMSPALN